MKKNPPGFAVLTGSQPKITTMNSASPIPNVKGGFQPSRITARPNTWCFDANRAIRACPTLGAGQKVVLGAIADRAGYGRSACTRSNEGLGEDSGIGAQQASNLVRELVKEGWITVEHHTGSKHSTRSINLTDKFFEEVHAYVGAHVKPRISFVSRASLSPVPAVDAPRRNLECTYKEPSSAPIRNLLT